MRPYSAASTRLNFCRTKPFGISVNFSDRPPPLPHRIQPIAHVWRGFGGRSRPSMGVWGLAPNSSTNTLQQQTHPIKIQRPKSCQTS
jgi:hypothetical protein